MEQTGQVALRRQPEWGRRRRRQSVGRGRETAWTRKFVAVILLAWWMPVFAGGFWQKRVMVGTGVAQTGSITGQIFDPAGAVIVNAKITATSASSGFTRTVTSTSAGIYNFGALPPSVYSLSATATGFQEQIKKDVTLSVAATLPVNFTLAISGTTAVIDVRDVSSASVETDSFQLSTVIDSKQINDLPLILRVVWEAYLLQIQTRRRSFV